MMSIKYTSIHIHITCSMSALTLTLNTQLRLISSICALFLYSPFSTLLDACDSFHSERNYESVLEKALKKDKRHSSHVDTDTYKLQSGSIRETEHTYSRKTVSQWEFCQMNTQSDFNSIIV